MNSLSPGCIKSLFDWKKRDRTIQPLILFLRASGWGEVEGKFLTNAHTISKKPK